MAFSEADYEKQVLQPVRDGGLSELPLAVRYAVDTTMNSTELRETIGAVRKYWSNHADRLGGIARLCKTLRTLDEGLQKEHGENLFDPSWWLQRSGEQQRQTAEAIKGLIADLKREFLAVGFVSEEELHGFATGIGQITNEQLNTAATEAGLVVRPRVQLPSESGLPPSTYRRLVTQLTELETPTIVDLLIPAGRAAFSLVEEFSMDGHPSAALDQELVQTCLSAAEALPDSSATRVRKDALSHLMIVKDIRLLALFHVAEQVRSANMPTRMIREGTRLGLRPPEARLLTFSLLGNARSTFDEVIGGLLRAGRLRAAQHAAAALPQSDRAPALAMVAAVEADVVRHLSQAQNAAAQHRLDEAERHLIEAIELAEDDPEIHARLAELPLAAPAHLRLDERGGEVCLTWSPTRTLAQNVTYVVVSSDTRPPRDPFDGSRSEPTTALAMRVGDMRVAIRRHHAVFAIAPGRPASAAAAVSQFYLPKVSDAQVSAEPGRNTLRWTVHPAAIAVRVKRLHGPAPDDPLVGTDIPVTGSSVTDHDVRRGEINFYSLVAVYADGAQAERISEPIVVMANPEATWKPIDDLSVTLESTTDSTMTVRLSWSTPGTSDQRVRIWAAHELPAEWRLGYVASCDALDRFGGEVDGRRTTAQGGHVMVVQVPNEPAVFVPAVVNGAHALLGEAVSFSPIAPVGKLEAFPAGHTIRFSWSWPDGVNLAETRWQAPNADDVPQLITRSQYVKSGGVTRDLGPDGGIFTVRSLRPGRESNAAARPVAVTVPGRPIYIHYSFAGLPSRMAGRMLRMLPLELSRPRLILEAELDCAGIDLLVVLGFDQHPPQDSEQGELIAQFTDVNLRKGEPRSLFLQLPAFAAHPRRLRCFFAVTTATLQLVAPPPDTMTVY